jgi:hypothetical protein
MYEKSLKTSPQEDAAKPNARPFAQFFAHGQP